MMSKSSSASRAKPFSLSVNALLRRADGRYLVLRRAADSKRYAGRWDLPGGKVEKGEDFAVAIMREAREETGLKIKLSKALGCAQVELPNVRVVILLMEAIVLGGTVRLSEEHDAHAWVRRADLVKLDLCPHFKTWVRKFFRARRGATASP